MAATVRSTPRRRVVRRARPTLDQAWATVLADLPAEVHPAMVRYIEHLRDGVEIRQALSSEMTRHHLRWFQVDRIAHSLMSVE